MRRLLVIALLLAVGCGESAEDRYAKALSLWKTESELLADLRDKEEQTAALQNLAVSQVGAAKAQKVSDKADEVLASLRGQIADQEKRVEKAKAMLEQAEAAR